MSMHTKSVRTLKELKTFLRRYHKRTNHFTSDKIKDSDKLAEPSEGTLKKESTSEVNKLTDEAKNYCKLGSDHPNCNFKYIIDTNISKDCRDPHSKHVIYNLKITYNNCYEWPLVSRGIYYKLPHTIKSISTHNSCKLYADRRTIFIIDPKIPQGISVKEISVQCELA